MKYVVYLRKETQGEDPHLLKLAEFEEDEKEKAQAFLDALRPLWMSSAYMKSEGA